MKKHALLLLLATLTFTLTGCGSQKDDTTSSDSSINGFTLSGSYGEVTLCNYKGLTGEKPVYELTEDDINSEIEYLLYDYVEYNDIDGPAESGQYVSAYITATSDGESLMDFSEELYEIYLGYEEFGPDFDKQLYGATVGDDLEFSITYEDDYEDEDFAGRTVDFTVSVESISEEILPEMTEEFIQNTLGYSSEDDMRGQIANELAEYNEAESKATLQENLIQQVIDQSTFGTYSQDIYDFCTASVEESYTYYAEMFGCEDVSEIYEMFGMTESDIEEEILSQVYRMIAVQAIAEENSISVSEDEFNSYVANAAEENEFDSAEDFLAAYDESSIRYEVLEGKVLDFLEENATVTEVTAEIED